MDYSYKEKALVVTKEMLKKVEKQNPKDDAERAILIAHQVALTQIPLDYYMKKLKRK